MENEIKVGEWIRTDNGIIGKYVKYRGIEDTIEINNKWIGFDLEKDIVKHSPNLIDIIQCGDYVNGHLVIDIPGDGSGAVYLEQITKGALIPTLKEDIETIVTKEMMESISYKVERKD